MSDYGYYEFAGRDADGWPHWKLLSRIPGQNLKEQEQLFKHAIIRYFRTWEAEMEALKS